MQMDAFDMKRELACRLTVATRAWLARVLAVLILAAASSSLWIDEAHAHAGVHESPASQDILQDAMSTESAADAHCCHMGGGPLCSASVLPPGSPMAAVSVPFSAATRLSLEREVVRGIEHAPPDRPPNSLRF